MATLQEQQRFLDRRASYGAAVLLARKKGSTSRTAVKRESAGARRAEQGRSQRLPTPQDFTVHPAAPLRGSQSSEEGLPGAYESGAGARTESMGGARTSRAGQLAPWNSTSRERETQMQPGPQRSRSPERDRFRRAGNMIDMRSNARSASSDLVKNERSDECWAPGVRRTKSWRENGPASLQRKAVPNTFTDSVSKGNSPVMQRSLQQSEMMPRVGQSEDAEDSMLYAAGKRYSGSGLTLDCAGFGKSPATTHPAQEKATRSKRRMSDRRDSECPDDSAASPYIMDPRERPPSSAYREQLVHGERARNHESDDEVARWRAKSSVVSQGRDTGVRKSQVHCFPAHTPASPSTPVCLQLASA